MTDNSCLFCRIISGDIPSKSAYHDEKVVVIEDISPQAPIHYLIIPRKHIETVMDIPAEENSLVGHVFHVASRIAEERGFASSGFRVVVNCNGDGGQTVWHLHFHLLAGRQLTWPPG